MSVSMIRQHYTIDGLRERIEAALLAAGVSQEPIALSDLAGIDQFHAGGFAATQKLANALRPKDGEHVLDVGCGLGGPARYLAAVHGCRVTGIDLTPVYSDVAEWLGHKTGLSDRLTFVTGDALALPFPDESFDHAWTLHVAMNISDKAGLYRGVYRVLKPGGRFAVYDIVRGDGGEVIYPVPWARTAETSFLVTPEAMTSGLEAAGFRVLSSVDTTPSPQDGSPVPAGPNPALNLGLVMGPEFGQMAANLVQKNLAEGRVRLRQIIAQKGETTA